MKTRIIVAAIGIPVILLIIFNYKGLMYDAILKGAPVLLFDEPTSALDRENQRRFLGVIKELKREKKVFVIAHKLGDLSAFEQVLELENGRITRREK